MTSTSVAKNVQNIQINLLDPHPQNPRIEMRQDVVDALAANMGGGFDPSHALITRKVGERYQIISGHHRHEAAKQAGLDAVPCWVRDMDDERAYMELVLCNTQSELHPLEEGKHAAESGMDLKAYAEQAGKARTTLVHKVKAWRVLSVTHVGHETIHDQWRNLAEIHAAPKEAWEQAVDAMIEMQWTVKDTRAAVARVKEVFDAKPKWFAASAEDSARQCLSAPAKAKTLAVFYKSLASMSEKLPETITLYRLDKTDCTEDRGGREYRKYISSSFEYAARSDFHERLNSAQCTNQQQAENIYKIVNNTINLHSDAKEEWRPVLTDKEQREKDQRIAELRRLELRKKLMPKVHHGDVIEVMKTLPSNSFDLVCIDPPYNMDKAEWDSLGNGAEFAEWAEQWLTECHRVMKDSGAIYVFGINRMLSHIQHKMDAIGFKYKNWITWDTIQGAGGGLWVNRQESILYYGKTASPYEDADSVKLPRHEENVREYKGKEYAFKNPSNVWRFPCVDDKHPERTEHPTQKPVELIERIIKASSPASGRVLDCFMGSGTTGVACMRAGRECVGIDANKGYIEIAQSRFNECEVPE